MRLIDADALEEYGQTQIQIVPKGNGAYTEMRVYYQNDIDIAPTVQAVPLSVLQEIRQEINKAIDCIPITFSRNNADDCLKRDIKDIFDKHIKEIEDIGDYPDEIPNQFDNMTGSMNL